MIGADAMVKCLEAEGVKSVFGYPPSLPLAK